MADRPLRQFLAALASRHPTPGGGSAAAAAAALGAALYVKVSRIVTARRGSPIAHRNATKIAQACQRHQRALVRLVDRDAKAYGRLRRRPSPAAQREALQAPLKICEQSRAALAHGPALTRVAGRSLGSDVEAGTALLIAGFVAAAAMVAVNLEAMGRGREAAAIRRKTRAFLSGSGR